MMREAALRALGLSPGADEAAVRAAYRRLAKECHPDVSVDHANGEAFKMISDAHEVLLGEGSVAAARGAHETETAGPAIRARWNIRRRHQPSEYPAWFKPSKPEPKNGAGGSRGLHTRASIVPLAPCVLSVSHLWRPFLVCMCGGLGRHARGAIRRLLSHGK